MQVIESKQKGKERSVHLIVIACLFISISVVCDWVFARRLMEMDASFGAVAFLAFCCLLGVVPALLGGSLLAQIIRENRTSRVSKT